MEDHETWDPKLPNDYEKRLHMSMKPDNFLETKKDLYNMFRKGILFQKGEVWFSLGSDGERIEVVSARMFSYKNRWSHRWRSVRESRFRKVAEMLDISNLNIQIKITIQSLSPGINYRVFLVFKFCGLSKSGAKQMYVNLKYKKGSENLHAYFATWRDDEWMTIELCRYTSHVEDTNFEVLLESFSRCYCGRRAVYIEGIEFQAIDDVSLKVLLGSISRFLRCFRVLHHMFMRCCYDNIRVQVKQFPDKCEVVCKRSGNYEEGEKVYIMLISKEYLLEKEIILYRIL
ncbi:hypothetical protein OSB04_001008 [Centaurea solstitialis]|uniref:Phloem protein 2-like protein n=1 Tax=Centaurea solstitialis TaxID=347529 RepID=A0AA38WLB6_9ASTR|nr:hypothetical protein OSB04_001008 [Centaurea solstitialis]